MAVLKIPIKNKSIHHAMQVRVKESSFAGVEPVL